MGANSSQVLAAAAGGTGLLFRQLFDADTGTFSYLLADVSSRAGVLIDAVFEQHHRDLALIHEDHPISHRTCKAHLVCDANHGDALACELDHDIEHLVDHLGV